MTGITRDCVCPRAQHEHGDYLAYLKDHCRCTPCRRAYLKKCKVTAYRTRTGGHTYVSAEPARIHVQQLLEVLTVGQVEARSGVNRTAIRVLVGDFPRRPASKRITRTTESALLAVAADQFGPEQHGLVDVTGTRRRLRALVAFGWNVEALRARLGWSSRTTWTLINTDSPNPIQAATRNDVAALYDKLSVTAPPPSGATTMAKNRGQRNGWPVPLAWDDDTIDDPEAAPFVGVPKKVMKRDRILDLVDLGESLYIIAQRCQTTPNDIQKVLTRADRVRDWDRLRGAAA